MKTDYTIVVDTREQEPLWSKNVAIHKLDVGDYSILGFEDKIAVERKSLSDLFQTLTHGHARFKAELTRSKDLDYFCIIVEGTYRKIQEKDFPGSYHTRMRGYVINKILITLHVKYGINIIYGEDRVITKQIIKNIFESYINKTTKIKKDTITQ